MLSLPLVKLDCKTLISKLKKNRISLPFRIAK